MIVQFTYRWSGQTHHYCAKTRKECRTVANKAAYDYLIAFPHESHFRAGHVNAERIT